MTSTTVNAISGRPELSADTRDSSLNHGWTVCVGNCLDDSVMGIRSPAGAREFTPLCVV
jgi:hypothetical protein